jgi:hypothetical protein
LNFHYCGYPVIARYAGNGDVSLKPGLLAKGNIRNR